ncbi:hypothetical protein [Geodermatophilus sp. SYSU D01105]
MTATAQPGATGKFGFLKEGMSAAGKLVADMKLDEKLTPLVDASKQAAQTGLKTAAHVGNQAREVVSQEKLWDEQRALVDSLVEVLSLQQSLIEDLRGRVSALESR